MLEVHYMIVKRHRNSFDNDLIHFNEFLEFLNANMISKSKQIESTHQIFSIMLECHVKENYSNTLDKINSILQNNSDNKTFKYYKVYCQYKLLNDGEYSQQLCNTINDMVKYFATDNDKHSAKHLNLLYFQSRIKLNSEKPNDIEAAQILLKNLMELEYAEKYKYEHLEYSKEENKFYLAIANYKTKHLTITEKLLLELKEELNNNESEMMDNVRFNLGKVTFELALKEIEANKNQLIKKDPFDESEKYFRMCLKNDHLNPDASFYLVKCHFHSEQYPTAYKNLEELILKTAYYNLNSIEIDLYRIKILLKLDRIGNINKIKGLSCDLCKRLIEKQDTVELHFYPDNIFSITAFVKKL